MMFNKKSCTRCGKKVNQNYDFCPSCGNTIRGKQKDLGMLGNGDESNEFENLTNNLFSGLGGGMLNKMLGNAMKMLEKEMQKEMKMQKKNPQSNMQLFINGKKIDVPNTQQPKQVQKDNTQISSIHFSEANQKKFISLEEQEPKTELKRIGDIIIYEVNLPKVKSIKDISIVKLENSVEVKAISKTKAYFKSIPINLPLTNHELNEEKLILEFESMS